MRLTEQKFTRFCSFVIVLFNLNLCTIVVVPRDGAVEVQVLSQTRED